MPTPFNTVIFNTCVVYIKPCESGRFLLFLAYRKFTMPDNGLLRMRRELYFWTDQSQRSSSMTHSLECLSLAGDNGNTLRNITNTLEQLHSSGDKLSGDTKYDRAEGVSGLVLAPRTFAKSWLFKRNSRASMPKTCNSSHKNVNN